MKLVEKQWQFLQDVALLINYAKNIGVVLTGGELYRTKEQQRIYVNNGRSKTMNSKHLQRLAIDFNFFVNGELTYDHPVIYRLGNYWESMGHGNKWGGNFISFKDTPHFQTTMK